MKDKSLDAKEFKDYQFLDDHWHAFFLRIIDLEDSIDKPVAMRLYYYYYQLQPQRIDELLRCNGHIESAFLDELQSIVDVKHYVSQSPEYTFVSQLREASEEEKIGALKKLVLEGGLSTGIGGRNMAGHLLKVLVKRDPFKLSEKLLSDREFIKSL